MHKIIAPLFFIAALLAVSFCANKSMVARASSEIRELKLDWKEPEPGHLGLIEKRIFNSDIPLLVKSLAAAQGTAEEAAAAQRIDERAAAAQGIAERAIAEQGIAERAIAEQGIAERAAAAQGIAERAIAEQGIAERAIAEQGIAERATAEQGTDERADLADLGQKRVYEKDVYNENNENNENNSSTQVDKRDLASSAKDESKVLSSDFSEREQVAGKKENLAKNKELPWQKIKPGLEYMLLPEPRGESFVIVAISPELYAFTLHMASETGEAMSLKAWAKQHGLLVAINASMYLPDRITSTGHMKSSTHVNNEYIGSRLGAFFVAEPRQKNLALVDILETDDSSWRESFEQYELRVQNFRILSRDGALQWKNGSSRHSVAAIGKNNSGKVFFILATRAMSIPDFATRLKESLADLSSVIYVEGSDKAALYLQLSADTEYLWQGRKNVFNFPADPHLTLPNIIGVSVRSQ